MPKAFHTDSEKLIMVIKVLLGNALKYTERGSIYLSLKMTNPPINYRKDNEFVSLDHANIIQRNLEIVVKDTGKGIEPQQQKELFVLFGRASKKITNHRHTTIGLGLAFCKGVLDRMGGTIYCDSEPGKGTSFILNLRLKTDRDDYGLRDHQQAAFLNMVDKVGRDDTSEVEELPVSAPTHFTEVSCNLNLAEQVPLTACFEVKHLEF